MMRYNLITQFGVSVMYAIAFDLEISELKKHYGDPYNNDTTNNLATVYKAINLLSKIEWFAKSVRDIRAFKVEDWSDFTAIVKGL